MNYNDDYELDEDEPFGVYPSETEEEEEEEDSDEFTLDHHRYSDKERSMIEEWMRKNRPEKGPEAE